MKLENICINMNKKKDYRRISTGILLDNWNIVGNILVTPVEMIRNSIKCEEYWPINNLRTCEKIIEKIVKDRLEEYFEKHSLLSKSQSSFRKRY